MNQARPIHLIIDATCLANQHYSGVENFTFFLIREFDQLASEKLLTYDLVVRGDVQLLLKQLKIKHFRCLHHWRLPYFLLKLLSLLHLPIYLDNFYGDGYYYFPSYTFYPLKRNPYALVIHDHTYVLHPEAVSHLLSWRLKLSLPAYLKHARQIFAVSDDTKAHFPSIYSIPAKRVVVTPPAVDTKHFYRRTVAEIKHWCSQYQLGGKPYLLVLGNIEPKKNLRRIIQAYRLLPENLQQRYQLIFIGENGWHNEDILEDIRQAQADGLAVKLLFAKVKRAEIPIALSGATALVFASFYEGFCMPPMEAYACGTLVIASKFSSSAQAIGKAAVCSFNPYSVGAIKQAMMKVTALSKSERLLVAERMRLYIANHTWRQTALITLQALKKSYRYE